MWEAINKLVTNVNMSFENIIVLVNFLGSLLFSAKNFKLGIIILMVTSGGIFVWFYEKNLDYSKALVIFFLSLITLVFTLYAVNKQTQGGII